MRGDPYLLAAGPGRGATGRLGADSAWRARSRSPEPRAAGAAIERAEPILGARRPLAAGSVCPCAAAGVCAHARTALARSRRSRRQSPPGAERSAPARRGPPRAARPPSRAVSCGRSRAVGQEAGNRPPPPSPPTPPRTLAALGGAVQANERPEAGLDREMGGSAMGTSPARADRSWRCKARAPSLSQGVGAFPGLSASLSTHPEIRQSQKAFLLPLPRSLGVPACWSLLSLLQGVLLPAQAPGPPLLAPEPGFGSFGWCMGICLFALNCDLKNASSYSRKSGEGT